MIAHVNLKKKQQPIMKSMKQQAVAQLEKMKKSPAFVQLTLGKKGFVIVRRDPKNKIQPLS